MNEVASGKVLKAYIEIEPSTQSTKRICLFLEGLSWIELTGVTLKDGFVLPSPLGCNCNVTDISDRQWDFADYEITFASSYSREGTFYAKWVNQIYAITM
jgi:hypothetical protein